MEKRLLEIKKRKEELRSLAANMNSDELDTAFKELEVLDKEEKEIEKRSKICSILSSGKINPTAIEKTINNAQEEEYQTDSKEYRSAYLKNLMGRELNEVEKRAMTSAANSVGATIPSQTINKIIEKLKQESVILPLVTRLNIPSNVIIPVEGTVNDVSWVAEGGTNDKDDTIGKIELGARQLIKTIEITAHVEKMSIDAFEDFITAELVKKAKAAIDNAIINGTGTNNTPNGILKSLTALKTALSSGYAYNDLMEILANVPSVYKLGAVFVINTKTL